MNSSTIQVSSLCITLNHLIRRRRWIDTMIGKQWRNEVGKKYYGGCNSTMQCTKVLRAHQCPFSARGRRKCSDGQTSILQLSFVHNGAIHDHPTIIKSIRHFPPLRRPCTATRYCSLRKKIAILRRRIDAFPLLWFRLS